MEISQILLPYNTRTSQSTDLKVPFYLTPQRAHNEFTQKLFKNLKKLINKRVLENI